MVVGVAAMVVVVVKVVEEVGILGCGRWLHCYPCCLTMWCCHVLMMRHAGHAKMELAPICQVVLEGELWGA